MKEHNIQNSYLIHYFLTLPHSFKTNLVEALGDAFPNAGSIRSEARSIYSARLLEAIITALSKHDHVFVPTSTSLGRGRTSTPTCMACDRPLTSKGRRGCSDTGRSSTDVFTKGTHRPNLSIQNNEAKGFVMRGGFKFDHQ